MLSELPEMLDAATLKGEVVVVIGGASDADAPDIDALVDETQTLVADGERPRDAAKLVAARHGTSANAIYRAWLALDDH